MKDILVCLAGEPHLFANHPVATGHFLGDDGALYSIAICHRHSDILEIRHLDGCAAFLRRDQAVGELFDRAFIHGHEFLLRADIYLGLLRTAV